jgi:uncharacterized MAPEG superfamily protein
MYPFGLLLLAVLVNVFVFGVDAPAAALPSSGILDAVIAAVALLLINHTWLMTATELVRVRNAMHSTPEEWAASGRNKEDVPEEGWRELERRHNAHRNTTENTVYFAILSAVICFASPAVMAAQIWLMTFPLARLGYTYIYLSGKVALRGVFMSLSLLVIFGMATYLVMGLLSS